MEPDRPSIHMRDLVSELDDKLAPLRSQQLQEIGASSQRAGRKVPAWAGFLLVTVLGIALATAAVRPWKERCSYGREVCAIANLDIDALRITIPDSALIATLPDIEALDPDDVLTAGDIFAMERFAHLDFASLLTDEDIERLLSRTE